MLLVSTTTWMPENFGDDLFPRWHWTKRPNLLFSAVPPPRKKECCGCDRFWWGKDNTWVRLKTMEPPNASVCYYSYTGRFFVCVWGSLILRHTHTLEISTFLCFCWNINGKIRVWHQWGFVKRMPFVTSTKSGGFLRNCQGLALFIDGDSLHGLLIRPIACYSLPSSFWVVFHFSIYCRQPCLHSGLQSNGSILPHHSDSMRLTLATSLTDSINLWVSKKP